MIKLRILKWEDYSGLSTYVGPTCNHKYPYKKEAGGDLTTEVRDVKMETRGWRKGSGAKECRHRQKL